MVFTEKLSRLTTGKRSRIAKAAGLPTSAVSNYISKKQMPRGDKALALARATGVPVEWLLDDSQDWPAPPSNAVSAITIDQLAAELGRRMYGVASALLAKLAKAQRIKWTEVAAELLKSTELLRSDIDAELPKKLRDLVTLPGQISALLAALEAFDPRCPVGVDAPPEILKEVRPEYELTLLELQRINSNLESHPGYGAANRLLGLWIAPKEWRGPWFKEHLEFVIERARGQLESARVLEAQAAKFPRKFGPKPPPEKK